MPLLSLLLTLLTATMTLRGGDTTLTPQIKKLRHRARGRTQPGVSGSCLGYAGLTGHTSTAPLRTEGQGPRKSLAFP